MADLARRWNVHVERRSETDTSLLAFGTRVGRAVVLKVIKPLGEGGEWRAGEVLRAFDGRGAVRVLEFIDGAVPLERATPGHSLVTLVEDGRDVEATAILADVIARMSGTGPPDGCPTFHDRGRSFQPTSRR